MMRAAVLLAFLTARGLSDGPTGTPTPTPRASPSYPPEPPLWPMEYREKFVQILTICVLMAFAALFIVVMVNVISACPVTRKAAAVRHHRAV
jgi:hypothetical protein